jgi:nucleoporin NDC1
MGWIERGGLNVPDKLNERPIYLRAVCLMLAIFQSCFFLYVDLGALKISIGRHRPASKSVKQDTHPKIPVKQQLRENGVSLVIYCAAVSALTAIVGPFIYSMTVRQWLWRFHLAFAKLFWNLSRANARAIGYPPCNPFMMLRSFGLGFLLLTLWMAASIAFSLFLDQDPLKKTVPLSTGSKDPNGTLLNGLRAKRDVVKTFAFWELAAISEKSAERRKAIFADIERPEGPCWASMQEAALMVVRQIGVRIDATKPKPPAAPQAPPAIEKLPSIAPPISEKQIVLSSPKGSTPSKQAQALIAAGAKRIGQSTHPWSPPVEKVKADLYERAQPSMQAASQWRSSLDKTLVGGLFMKTKERNINAVTLGTPQSESVVLVDAISSVTKMLVASLSEDVYGKVNKGVPEVVRTFSKTINGIEVYVQSLGRGVDGLEIEDVLIVHALLKASLAELLSAFQMYLHDVGLGVSELNTANNAARKKELIEAPSQSNPQPEMKQPQQRRQLGERQRRPNGQAAASRRPSQAQAAIQSKPQPAQVSERRSSKQPRVESVYDDEEEAEREQEWEQRQQRLPEQTAAARKQMQEQAATQSEPQYAQTYRRLANEKAQFQDNHQFQEYYQSKEDRDDEEEVEVEMPWSNPRRKLFDTVSPITQDQNWLGNDMYGVDAGVSARQRRGFEVESPS